ncbi:ribosomal protein S18-alanine N-acetyltransferase [Halocatena halophila]|uniref:ribosomal protein S18-alanine N-acetyltransferase n=1 Tax=Halocatena halophila TaxID=2814576 RepID=UPI002ED0ED73
MSEPHLPPGVTAIVPDTNCAVRQAVRADLLSVYRIEQASFAQPWNLEAFEQFLGEPTFLVGERSGTIVGYIVADLTPNHGRAIGHIKDFAVHPDHRGERIGSTILQRALSDLGLRGAATVKLEVRRSNTSAINCYRSHGFVYHQTIPRYYHDGEDALIMIREMIP